MTDTTDTKVALGFIDNGMVHHQFLSWVVNHIQYDLTHRQLVWGAGGGRISVFPCHYQLAQGRNEVVAHFLAGTADWLWFVDTDMSFPLDALDRLVDVADPIDRPIMAGAYLYMDPPSGMVVPSFGVEHGPNDPQRAISILNQGVVTEIGWAGTGCLLIHRTVFCALAKVYPGPWTWFAYDQSPWHKDRILMEDTTFCLRARAAGFPVHVHPGVRAVHHGKPVDLSFDTCRPDTR